MSEETVGYSTSRKEPEASDAKVVQLEAMLKVCEAEKAGLEKLLATKDEIIELLREKK